MSAIPSEIRTPLSLRIPSGHVNNLAVGASPSSGRGARRGGSDRIREWVPAAAILAAAVERRGVRRVAPRSDTRGHSIIAAGLVRCGLGVARDHRGAGCDDQVDRDTCRRVWRGQGAAIAAKRIRRRGDGNDGVPGPLKRPVPAPHMHYRYGLAVHRQGHAFGHCAHKGRNVADALTVVQVTLGLLRQHLDGGQMLHGIATRGGAAPNIREHVGAVVPVGARPPVTAATTRRWRL